MKLILGFIAVLLTASPALAGYIPFHAAQCYPAATGGATKVGPSNVSGSPTAPTVRLEFANGSTQTAFCIFALPPTFPTPLQCTGSGTPWGCCTGSGAGATCTSDVSLIGYSSVGDGNVRLEVATACHPSDAGGDLTQEGVFDWANAELTTTQSFAAPNPISPVMNNVIMTDADSANYMVNPPCLVKISRIGGDGADTDTGTLSIESGLITYYPDN